ncbi:carboxypeptidase regulatory-like domain-containing protein [Sphingobacterium sp. LRF_L2]|uniref:carboxypeptidase regulatory-like domain-containing protein n=1 Tax=Sphingobacterium sp. LRF_L2 TaxID=3369421 RepID=UPI003F617694
MNRKKLLTLGLFLCCIFTTVFAQSHGTIKGVVRNENGSFLEKATVSVLQKQDSSVISYTLTDKVGKFNFIKLPANTDLLLYITHIDGAPFATSFNLKEKEIKDFGNLSLGAQLLEEVTVTAVAPIRMNNDTLEYNADYFKTLPNANIEELLKKLPGLQVNMDGTIYYQGKEVSSVKVNGKDFFASDLKIATRNLDASLVKTVQVYRDKGESKQIVEDEEELPVTINLKFKKDFLSTDFGKLYASAGTRNRYEAGGLFNTFRDTLQISFIGFGNNINRQSFDYSELYEHGGLNRAENYGFDNFGGRNYWGIGNDIAGGFNLSNDWGKKTKLSIMYMLASKKTNSESQNDGTAIFDGLTQFSNGNYDSEGKSVQHNIRSLFRHRFDTTAYFEFTPSLSLSTGSGQDSSISNTFTQQQKLTYSRNENENSRRNFSYSHNFFIEKQLSSNHVFSVRNEIRTNQNKQNTEAIQHSILFQNNNPETYILSHTTRSQRENNFYASASYANKVIKKLNFDYFISFRDVSQTPKESLYADSTQTGLIHLPELENNYRYSYQDYISGIRFYWKPIEKLNINIGTAYQIKNNYFDFFEQLSAIRNRRGYWLPNINIRFKSLNFTWARDMESPRTSSIQVNDNTLNPLQTSLRSVNFDNILRQDYRLSFNIYKQKYQFGLYSGITLYDRGVGSRIWRNAQTGQYTFQAYQSAGLSNANSSLHIRYQVFQHKKWNVYLSNQSNLYIYENYSTINDIENKTSTITSYIKQDLSLMWNNLIGITPSYTFNFTKTLNSVKNNLDFMETSYKTHKLTMGINIQPVRGFSLESSYALENRASGLNQRQNFNILNASLYYQLKNRGQLKVSGFDILNQNTANYWGANGNNTYFSNQLTLRQYFLLGYVHKFNYAKTK